MAKTTWFATSYIRRRRLPAPGESLGEWIFCETQIAAPGVLGDDQLGALLPALAAQTHR